MIKEPKGEAQQTLTAMMEDADDKRQRKRENKKQGRRENKKEHRKRDNGKARKN